MVLTCTEKVRGDMELSDLLLTIPSLACLGILLICTIALLIAPPRFVRASFLVMFVTVISYIAILVITLAGSFNPTATDTTTTTQDTGDSDSGSDTAPAPTAPPSDGATSGY
jgi:hypothetical protein